MRRARGRRSWSREDSRRRHRRPESRRSRDGSGRGRRQRSRSIRDKRKQRNERVEKERRQNRSEVAQLRRDLAAVSHDVYALKASSGDTILPPRTQQARQDQEEHNVRTKGSFGQVTKMELARMFQDEAAPTLKETIKKGKHKIDKNKLMHIAGCVSKI